MTRFTFASFYISRSPIFNLDAMKRQQDKCSSSDVASCDDSIDVASADEPSVPISPSPTPEQIADISWNPQVIRKLPWAKVENFLPIIWLPLTFVTMTALRGKIKPDTNMRIFKCMTGLMLAHGGYKMLAS